MAKHESKPQPDFAALFGTVLPIAHCRRWQEKLRREGQLLHRAGTPSSPAGTPEPTALTEAVQESGISFKTDDEWQDFFRQSEAYLQSLMPLRIYLAVPADANVRRSIQQLLETKGPAIPLSWEIVVDARIVGGAIIEWQGRRLDYSLAARLPGAYGPDTL